MFNLVGKALIMAYIYLYSATDKADIREFTSPLILFMVTDEDENYGCEIAWGPLSLASGRSRGLARKTPPGSRRLYHNGVKY